MKRMLVIDPYRCTGCRLCELICSATKQGEFKPSASRIRIVSNSRIGLSIPTVCLQCRKPWCQSVCAAEAIERDPISGIVTVNEEKCHGCRQCISACPYGNMGFDIDRGIATKCDLCKGTPRCVEVCYPNAIESKDLHKSLTMKSRILFGKTVQQSFASQKGTDER